MTPTHEFLDPLSGIWTPIAAPVRRIRAKAPSLPPAPAQGLVEALRAVFSDVARGDVYRPIDLAHVVRVEAYRLGEPMPHPRALAALLQAVGFERRRTRDGIRYVVPKTGPST